MVKGNYSSINRGDHKKAREKRSKSTKGYYVMAFTEPFDRLNERDIEIRGEYAMDAVSRYYGIHKSYVRLRRKSRTIEGVNLDEVYYVYVGQHPVGKISIRITRFGTTYNRMLLLYQHKRSVPKRHVQHKFKQIRTDREKRRAHKKSQRGSRKGRYKPTR